MRILRNNEAHSAWPTTIIVLVMSSSTHIISKIFYCKIILRFSRNINVKVLYHCNLLNITVKFIVSFLLFVFASFKNFLVVQVCNSIINSINSMYSWLRLNLRDMYYFLESWKQILKINGKFYYILLNNQLLNFIII